MTITQQEIERWEQLVAFYISKPDVTTLTTQIEQFLAEPVDHTVIVEYALEQNAWHIATAFKILDYFSSEALMPFLESSVSIVAFSQGFMDQGVKLILKMPRAWVIENIEAATEPSLIFAQNSYLEYRQILSLYNSLDKALASKFAHRALDNPDPDIRDMGKIYLEP